MAWTIRSVLSWTKGYLHAKGSDTPRLDAEVLLAHVLGKGRIDLYLDMDRPLGGEELASYRVLLERRSEGEPIAYILGNREFYSHDFIVNRDVLIPRPETEILVEKAVELAPRDSEVFEIGVGSGAVIISILLERPDLVGYGNDIDKAALAVAKENAKKHGIADRLHLFKGDTCKALSMRFHTIVVNPPYIALSEKSTLKGDVRLFEPGHALFAGNDGLDIIREIIAHVKACLFPGGRLIMEAGYDQKGAVEQMVRAAEDLNLLLWIRDLAGIDRAVVVERTHG
ncbi:MAG TPA: peptide chain release factor N(5)-glutamine methyltransferase [Deltaproteobacteria bacterium]|nr:peptide chain release factor N(5)-glutamine methyltransferase [Deltaproteobacteria bacterium]HQI01325.1 peptide chain release factor N(5)-glutamine methyltransferase [Deltaproteobacteria bacterium]HQJ07578.1 peptide chain release factor N(5)-glutamine methyltransferase [Deltaproteobacteria bacterium]